MFVVWDKDDPHSIFGTVGGMLFFEVPKTGGSLLDYRSREWTKHNSPKQAIEVAEKLAKEHFMCLVCLAPPDVWDEAIQARDSPEADSSVPGPWRCCGMVMAPNERCKVCGDRY